MKAVVLTGKRQMEIRDIPAPTIKNDTDVLLKIEMVGVCGSDVHYYETGKIGSQVVQYPYIVGHECAATVKAVGCAVTKLKVADRVAIDPAISCCNCDQCNIGRLNTCRKLKFLGCPGQADGCLCEFIVMPEASCYPCCDKLSPAQAVLCEPLAIGVYAVRQAGVTNRTNVAVLGAGPIGLSCLLAAKAQNAAASYATEKIKERIEKAKIAGAVWAGNPDRQDIVEEILNRQPEGLDVVFECAGQQETINQAVEILKPGGKLMLIGIPRSDRISFVIDKLRRKEITIINVRRQNKCTSACIELISSGAVDVDFMVTHKFKLDQTKEAFDLVAGYRDGVVKAVIEF
jgi:L-iditol 2-dehydrogenase